MKNLRLVSSSHSIEELRSLLSDAYKSNKEVVRFGPSCVSKGVISTLADLYVENEFETDYLTFTKKEPSSIYAILDKSGYIDPIMMPLDPKIQKNLRDDPLKLFNEYISPSTQAISVLYGERNLQFLSGPGSGGYDQFPEIFSSIAEAKRNNMNLDVATIPYGWSKKKNMTIKKVPDIKFRYKDKKEVTIKSDLFIGDFSGDFPPAIYVSSIKDFNQAENPGDKSKMTLTEKAYDITEDIKEKELLTSTFIEVEKNIWAYPSDYESSRWWIKKD